MTVTKKQPNIVLILSDQQPFKSMGCTGSKDARTPNLDALAKRGVLFENHFTTNPVCMPSRASIFSGQHIKQHGVWANGVRMPLDMPNMPSLLRRRGYQTAHFGKLHLEPVLNRVGRSTNYHFDICEVAEGDQQLTHDADAHFTFLREKDPDLFFQYICEMYGNGHEMGYKSLMPNEMHLSTFVANRGCDFLENRRDGRPFFLSLGFFDPHHAFNPCEPWWSMFEGQEFERPSFEPDSLATRPPHYHRLLSSQAERHTRVPEKMDTTLRAFHAMMAHVDASVGRVVDALEKADSDRETIVIYSSDHGEFLGEYGFLLKGPFMLDQLLRVPLICANLSTGGARDKRVSELTSSVDLLPTMLGLTGGAGEATLPGRPIFDSNILTGISKARTSILAEWEGLEDGPERTQRCVRTRKHKLVVQADDSVGELYDLEADPKEHRNVFSDPKYSGVKSDLLEELAGYENPERPDLPKECGW